MSCCLLFCPLIADWRSQFTSRFIYRAAPPRNQSQVSCLLRVIPLTLSDGLKDKKKKKRQEGLLLKLCQKGEPNERSRGIINGWNERSHITWGTSAPSLRKVNNNTKRCQTSHRAKQTPWIVYQSRKCWFCRFVVSHSRWQRTKGHCGN